jgi:thioesterase domain-containing protein
VALFVAGDTDVVGARAAAWSAFAQTSVHAMPGNHFTMHQPPHVADLARLLEREMAWTPR